MPKKPAPRKPKSHTRLVLLLLCVLAVMVAFVCSAVPLYRTFCNHFGIAVPTIVTAASQPQFAPDAHSTRTVTVNFVGNVGAGVPLEFQPLEFSKQVTLGQPVLTAYEARNFADKGFDGVAVHMLYAMGGPLDMNVADYIDLQQCFCFTQEFYPARQQVRLPLSFIVSTKLPKGVHTIVFSYSVFKALPHDKRILKDPKVVSTTLK